MTVDVDVDGRWAGADVIELSSGTIEHASLPSGLHLTEEDSFVFRHGGYPAVALFRNRPVEPAQEGGGGSKGRGRRMASVGVVLGEIDHDERIYHRESDDVLMV